MANRNILKSLELRTKHFLKQVALWLLPRPNRKPPELDSVRKVLVYRLDQRIGNGLLLLPLLRAIRTSIPGCQLDFLIHKPVADFLKRTGVPFVSEVIPYDQPNLLRRPWQLVRLFHNLKCERYDVAITSHNPDNFSVSQALLGKYLRPRFLVGFDWKDSAKFYDIAVKGSTEKHYAEAMVDLWRSFDAQARFKLTTLSVSHLDEAATTEIRPKGILFWLGATGGKKLPAELIAFLYEQLNKLSERPIQFAAGPADIGYINTLPGWIKERTLIWQKPFTETALFFSSFSAFISGDTGPMHLAVALGLPTLTIFIDSNLTQYGYNDGQKHFALFWKGSPESRIAINNALQKLFGKV